jgi:Fic family protein
VVRLRLPKTQLEIIRSISKKFDVEYKTAESDIEKLINVGILKKLETAKIKSYYSPDILASNIDNL